MVHIPTYVLFQILHKWNQTVYGIRSSILFFIFYIIHHQNTEDDTACELTIET